MGQTGHQKSQPQKSEITHFTKKNQNGLPPQGYGKMGSGATLSYVESSQSFKPSPVKNEGANTKNFPLSIQKTSTHKT